MSKVQQTLSKPRKPEPSFYIFRLLRKHPKYYEGSAVYPPYYGLSNEDDIHWPFINGVPVSINDTEADISNADWEPRRIRYVFGLRSIFVDEQEKDGRPLESRLVDNVNNKDLVVFKSGEITVQGQDRVLRDFLWCSGKCKNHHPFSKPNMVDPFYELIDFAYSDQVKVEVGKLKEKAYEIARTARKEELMPHAKFLNIPLMVDYTNDERGLEAIREDYVDFALSKPKIFLDSFNDPVVKINSQIRDLIAARELTINGIADNQAHWVKTSSLISVLPPDEEPVKFLAHFALTKQGAEFAEQLKAYNIARK